MDRSVFRSQTLCVDNYKLEQEEKKKLFRQLNRNTFGSDIKDEQIQQFMDDMDKKNMEEQFAALDKDDAKPKQPLLREPTMVQESMLMDMMGSSMMVDPPVNSSMQVQSASSNQITLPSKPSRDPMAMSMPQSMAPPASGSMQNTMPAMMPPVLGPEVPVMLPNGQQLSPTAFVNVQFPGVMEPARESVNGTFYINQSMSQP